MKDAMGGIFTLQAIVVALLIIMCLMAFAVNYSKAFRVKNEIRSIIEKDEGFIEAFKDPNGISTREKINQMIRNYSYFLDDRYTEGNKCAEALGDGWMAYEGIASEGGEGVRFCIKCEYANNMGEINNVAGYRGAYYSIVTYVNIDVPIVNNIIPFTSGFFKVSGETALIYSDNHNNIYCVGK